MIENWTTYRDARDWKRFRTMWHDDGVMQATWFQGSADEEGYAKDVRIHHILGERSVAIYETDRIDPVPPGTKVKLDSKLLSKMPEDYCHLAYLQTKVGYRVKPDMPGRDGLALEAPYRQGAAWLNGKKK